jgi:hypothetical protein
MTTENRTCSNCVSFVPDEGCLGSVIFITRNGRPAENGQAQPDDYCSDHMTVEEDRAETEAIALFWRRIGIKPRIGRG